MPANSGLITYVGVLGAKVVICVLFVNGKSTHIGDLILHRKIYATKSLSHIQTKLKSQHIPPLTIPSLILANSQSALAIIKLRMW
jgi:hypothetical protein